MEAKKQTRTKSKRINVDVTPEFHKKILDEIPITNENMTVHIIRLLRENMEKRNKS